MTTAGERRGVVVEAEEQLLRGSRGFMVRSWRLEIEDRWGWRARLFIFFSFLGGYNFTSNSTLYNPTINRG
jgi:hypothetical protein